VPNGAFEQAADLDLRMPLAWNAATWGTNTAAFSYGSFGSVDNHAATLTVSAYTSGDAKWFFDPVPVVPGARYLFTDSYVASAESFVTARITMADGSYRYIQLGRAQPSAALGTARFAFLAPDGAVSATVMHGLSAVGSLTFDDASFVALPPVTITNGVPNAGLEQGGPGETFPSAWYTNSWGVNDATFSYLTRGAAGVHSAGVAIRSLTTGRAAWYFEAQPVNSALVYGFADSYQSDVDTVPLAIVTLSDGTNVNVPLPVAFSSADWAPYSAEIYLPSGATSATVYHQLAKVGYLNTDEYALLPTTPQGFQRGLVSITIDDSWLNDYTEALPVLSARRAVATHYVITGSLGESARMTPAMLRNLAARGHEIAAHTVTHSDLTSLTPAQISNELAQSKAALQASLVGAVTNFASPYGAYNRSVVTDSRGLFRSHRTTDVGFNSKGSFDPYRLKVQNIRSTTTLAELNGWVARAARERLWLILVYHDVVASGGSIYSCTPAALDAHLAAIQAARLPIVTVNQALTEVTRQVP